MSEDVQQVYHYSVWYDVWVTLKRWAPRVLAVLVLIYVMKVVITKAPTWLGFTLIGFLLALPGGYFFVSRFFRIDYWVVLDVDLEGRTITPYFFPVKLFQSGKWVIEGVKAPFREEIEFSGLDSDLTAINKELEEIDAKIRALEKERKEILELIAKAERDKKQRKKEKEEYERYQLLKSKYDSLLKRYDRLKEQLFNEKNPLKLRKLNYELKNLEEEIEQTLAELRSFKHVPKEIDEKIIEEIIISIKELKAELLEIDDEIAALKAEKNKILEQYAILSDDGMKIFVADEIDWREKKIVLSPLHGYSDLELAIDKERFKKLKEKVDELAKKYAKLSVEFQTKTYEELAELFLELEDKDTLAKQFLEQEVVGEDVGASS